MIVYSLLNTMQTIHLTDHIKLHKSLEVSTYDIFKDSAFWVRNKYANTSFPISIENIQHNSNELVLQQVESMLLGTAASF